MITEPARFAARFATGAAILAGLLFLLLMARIGLAALTDAGGTLIVLGLDRDRAGALPDGATIESWGARIAVIRADNLAMTRWLYRNGALLVMPGKDGTCINLRAAPAKKEPDV